MLHLLGTVPAQQVEPEYAGAKTPEHPAAETPSPRRGSEPPEAFLTEHAGAVTAVDPPGEIAGRRLSWPGPVTGYGCDAARW